jgi:hypothetical protein
VTGYLLGGLPKGFAATRDDLHQIAFFALSPARYKETGRMGLRHHPRGFGTPRFEGKVARVEADLLVFESDAGVATQQITSVRSAAEFFGHGYDPEWYTDFRDPLQATDPDRRLEIDADSTDAIGALLGFGWAVLEDLRTHADPKDDVSEIQLWPEHFDAATELGDPDLGQRASYGISPGDHAHPEPYAYVAAWSEIDRDNPYWNDSNFNGASRPYADLVADGHEGALAFYLEGHRLLHPG